MKHLLMLIPFFPPMGGGGVYRPLSFVRHLPAHGWRITVVTPAGDAYWIRDESLVERVPADTRVIRTQTWSGQAWLSRGRRGRASARRSSRGFGVVRRVASAVMLPDSYVGWVPFAVRAALEVAKSDRVDAVYSTSPPESTHLAGFKVHRATGLPWVADFRDPWMNLHLLDTPSPLHREMHRRMERRVVTNADVVVVTTMWNERAMHGAYPSANIVRISNGYEGGEMTGPDERPAPRPMRIVHAGMLTQRRSATPFIEALARVVAHDPSLRGEIEVQFIGPREDANEHSAARLGLSDVVTFGDPLPHADALRAQRAAHVLLLVKHADTRYDGLVPGKLYEYIGLRRPVLALAPPGEARDLVTSLRRGEVATPADVDEIERALRTMIGHWRAGRLESAYDLSPRPEFDRAQLAGDLAAALATAVEKR
ncbi:MAG TPA: glycosyltransferase [Candidatus Krumholzibacteria bacterium]|nr:glycosyltransferase [Candidatus Krumholzibacteria bacterium]